jgi:hypothetical protein
MAQHWLERVSLSGTGVTRSWEAFATATPRYREQLGGADAFGEAENGLRQLVGGFHGGVVAYAVE